MLFHPHNEAKENWEKGGQASVFSGSGTKTHFRPRAVAGGPAGGTLSHGNL